MFGNIIIQRIGTYASLTESSTSPFMLFGVSSLRTGTSASSLVREIVFGLDCFPLAPDGTASLAFAILAFTAAIFS